MLVRAGYYGTVGVDWGPAGMVPDSGRRMYQRAAANMIARKKADLSALFSVRIQEFGSRIKYILSAST